MSAPTPVRHVEDAERRARLGVQHRLATPAATPEDVATALVGLHATEPASIGLAVWARTPDVMPADVEHALWCARTLVMQLSLRQTLFAYPRDLLPAVLASSGRRGADSLHRSLARLVEKNGIAADGPAWVEDACAAVVTTLTASEEPLSTRAVREATPAASASFSQGEGTRWAGTVQLTPRIIGLAHLRGQVARAANDGPWWTSRPLWSPAEALALPDPRDGWRELVGRYLRANGPATVDDVTWWLGATKGIATTALADLDAQPVTLDGTDRLGWLLPDDLAVVDAPDGWVALLPILDQTIMGWKDRRFIEGPHASALYDSVGNAGTTAWVDGRIVGAWAQDADHRVRLNLLEPVAPSRRAALERDAPRLTDWIGPQRVYPVHPSSAMTF